MIVQRLPLVLAVLVAAAPLAACQSGASAPSPPEHVAPAPAPAPAVSPAAPRAAALTRVADPSLVCMVNDQVMNKPQIPVEVAGKTYFGCCPMCKEKLELQAAARTSTDPVTGETVDKASAVIAQDADGRVRYFASEQTLGAYNAKL